MFNEHTGTVLTH